MLIVSFFIGVNEGDIERLFLIATSIVLFLNLYSWFLDY